MLAALDRTAGLHAAGRVAGLACAVGVAALLARAIARRGGLGLGPADHVTQARVALVGGVLALVADGALGGERAPALVAGLAALALLLDNLDGRVARRTGTASALGARFDMEVDALLILVLGAQVAPTYGPWVLAMGAARYVYVAAGWGARFLRGTPPPRPWRRVVAAIQGVVLAAAATEALPGLVVVPTLLVALALLADSFGRDVWWLWRDRALVADPPPQGGHAAS